MNAVTQTSSPAIRKALSIAIGVYLIIWTAAFVVVSLTCEMGLAIIILILFVLPFVNALLMRYRRRAVRKTHLAVFVILVILVYCAGIAAVLGWYGEHREFIEFRRLLSRVPAFRNIELSYDERLKGTPHWMRGMVASDADLDRLRSVADQCRIYFNEQIQLTDTFTIAIEEEGLHISADALGRNAVKLTEAELGYLNTLTDHPSLKLIAGPRLSRDATKRLKEIANLRSLDLSSVWGLWDDDLECLEGLTSLQSLNLRSSPLTGKGLKYLKGLTNLRSLSLHRSGITDADLECLKEITNLRALDLGDNQSLTNTGLEHIKGLTSLQSLNLSGTKVNYVGLEHLEKLTDLQSLDIGAPK